jgi:hypothetical protein
MQADTSLGQMDWDDAEGNARRRLAGLQHEKLRQVRVGFWGPGRRGGVQATGCA